MNAESSSLADPRPEIHGCVEACRRCRDVVERIRAADSDVARAVYGRVGPHLRHCLDHFRCLLRALAGGGEIDYDARDREAFLEVDPERMAGALAEVERDVAGLAGTDLDRPVRVRQAVASGGRQASSTSNLARELVFLSGHTIHHLAVIRLLCESGGVAVPEDLTMAYSTEAYRSRTGTGSG